MPTMTTDLATRIIRDCFHRDLDNEGIEALLAADAGECIANWRKYSAEAGDLVVVLAIDTLGAYKAAGIWEAELVAAEQAEAA